MSTPNMAGTTPAKEPYKKHPLVSGIVCLGIGLFLLAVNYGYLPDVEQSWPVIVILIGVAILVSTLVRRKRV